MKVSSYSFRNLVAESISLLFLQCLPAMFFLSLFLDSSVLASLSTPSIIAGSTGFLKSSVRCLCSKVPDLKESSSKVRRCPG